MLHLKKLLSWKSLAKANRLVTQPRCNVGMTTGHAKTTVSASNSPPGNLQPTNAKNRAIASSELREGMEIEGFVIQQISKVPDFQLTAFRLLHFTTGAQYLHVHREDSNNAFSVGFRTTPENSSGLPHILEHITLCGSKKFPCRDPFFKMLNRSMATFMNAMTGPDYTIYPFSTQNSCDYTNLMSVYLDAVFQPNLKEFDFLQEGWRLEHEDANDASTPIIFKGVVFNEMRGVFSENQSLFGQQLLNSILPTNTYGHVSGGDPLAIPSLTYEDLKSFHKSFYSPSNCRFYSYGNLPLVNHLKYINANYLRGFKKAPTSAESTIVPLENRWTATKRKHIIGRSDPMCSDVQKQSSLAIGYLCSDINNIEETFILQVLGDLLVKGPNSAFYKTLVETNIGAGFSPVTGYDPQTRDTIFTVGLQGLDRIDFDKVVKIIDDTFESVILNGFKEEHVEGILHGIEVNMRHQSANFGLELLFGLNPLWNHDGDLIQSLNISDQIIALRRNLKNNPRFLQDKVAQYFRDNTHRLILTMSPDADYEVKQALAENNVLQSKINQLTVKDKEVIYDQGLLLLKQQQQVEDTECLPTLKVADLAENIEKTSMQFYNMLSVPLQVYAQPTNGITYFRGVVDASHFGDEVKILLPLFTQVAAKMGTTNYNYRQLDELIHLKMGGLSISNHIAENLKDMSKYEEGIYFNSYCLDRNIKDMFGFWSELFVNVSLNDIDRFNTLVRVIAAELVNGIADSGHHYAMSSSAALVSKCAWRKELSGGLSYIAKMRELARMDDLQPILAKMRDISANAFTKNKLRCCVHMSHDMLPAIFEETKGFIETLPVSESTHVMDLKDGEVPVIKSTHHILPIPVNYAAKSISAIPYTHPHFAPLKILSRLVTFKYLHPNIREKGGAYGSGATLSSSGVFSFYSYRDPNSLATFDIFDKSMDWVSGNNFSDKDIEEAKLGIFQNVDAPVPPGSKGLANFLYRLDDNLRQQHRVALKGVTREHIHEVAKIYLANQNCGRSLLGPENPSLLARKEQNWEIVAQES